MSCLFKNVNLVSFVLVEMCIGHFGQLRLGGLGARMLSHLAHHSYLSSCTSNLNSRQTILTLPLEGDFPEIAKLRERGKSLTGYIVSPKERVKNITRLLAGDIKNNVSSGDFIEIRSLI